VTNTEKSKVQMARTIENVILLDNRPATAVELCIMKRYNSLTKLTDINHFSSPKTSKCCLTTSEQDSNGELETHLYKTYSLLTAGNGAQIISDGAAAPGINLQLQFHLEEDVFLLAS
jgi:hypothetical protein